jgi:hypothetical protein
MAFHVRDAATDRAVRRLARLKGKTLTDTIREAVEHEYAAAVGRPPLIRASYCPILPTPWKDSTHPLIAVSNVAM